MKTKQSQQQKHGFITSLRDVFNYSKYLSNKQAPDLFDG